MDNLKDLIGKIEQGLDTAGRAAAAGNAPPDPRDDRTDLAALKDPGRRLRRWLLRPTVDVCRFRLMARELANLGFRWCRRHGKRHFSGHPGGRPGHVSMRRLGGLRRPFRNYGQVLILNAGGGYHVVLAGMDRISVNVGQFVLTGEPVAVMGGGVASRRAAGGVRAPSQPVLYVEFRKDGTPIDPSPWWATSKGEKVRG